MKYIEEKTERLLSQLKIENFPIDPEACAELLNVKVHGDTLEDDISGIFIAENGEYHIIYNIVENEQRQRFTIAHELGHYFLHKNSKLFVDRKQKTLFRDSNSATGVNIKEREANAFAAALLMPKHFVEEEVNKLTEQDDIVDKLAELFNVSKMSMSFRLSNLGYELW